MAPQQQQFGGLYGSMFEELNAAHDRLVDAYNQAKPRPTKEETKPQEPVRKVEVTKPTETKVQLPKETDISLNAEKTNSLDVILTALLTGKIGASIVKVDAESIEFKIATEQFVISRKSK